VLKGEIKALATKLKKPLILDPIFYRKLRPKLIRKIGSSCPEENGLSVCILPQGRRPDPPQPLKVRSRWRPPTKDIFRPFLEAVEKFDMIRDGDRVLVCLSGGKDSLTLLHTMRQYQVTHKIEVD
jgi:hypothetical protein